MLLIIGYQSLLFFLIEGGKKIMKLNFRKEKRNCLYDVMLAVGASMKLVLNSEKEIDRIHQKPKKLKDEDSLLIHIK